MRRLQASIPELPHMRYIVQAETRTFVTNEVAEVKDNIIYVIPPKRTAARNGTCKEKATTNKIIILSEHI